MIWMEKTVFHNQVLFPHSVTTCAHAPVVPFARPFRHTCCHAPERSGLSGLFRQDQLFRKLCPSDDVRYETTQQWAQWATIVSLSTFYRHVASSIVYFVRLSLVRICTYVCVYVCMCINMWIKMHCTYIRISVRYGTFNSSDERPLLCRVADPVFCFWIRIRLSNFSRFGSGSSGFSPDSGTKKECRKVSKRD